MFLSIFFIERQYFIMFGRLDKNILQLQPKWRWMLSGRLQLSRNLCHIPHCCHMQCQICVRCECGVLRNIFAWRVFICNTHDTHTVLTLKHTHCTHFSSVRFGSVSFRFCFIYVAGHHILCYYILNIYLCCITCWAVGSERRWVRQQRDNDKSYARAPTRLS